MAANWVAVFERTFDFFTIYIYIFFFYIYKVNFLFSFFFIFIILKINRIVDIINIK